MSDLAEDEPQEAEPDRDKFEHPTVRSRAQQLGAATKDKFDVFLKWCLDNGAEFQDLDFVCYSETVRGVRTRRDVAAYSRFMTIPLKLLITDTMARATPAGQRLEAAKHELTVPNHCQVIMFMMMDRATGKSFYQPYYDVMPADFNNFPVFWDEDDVNRLKGSSMVHQIKDRLDNMRSDYDAMCKAVPEFAKFTFEDFLYFRTAVGSRNFSIVVKGIKTTAMVPQADMLNHHRPRETSWTFDNTLNAFTMTSLGKIPSGSQVFDSYGKKCNSKFLLHYGFALEDNRELDGRCMNELEVDVRLDPEDELFEERSKVVAYHQRFRITMNATDRGSVDIFAWLRVAVGTKEELRRFARGFKHGVMSATNEAAALELLAKFMKAKLSRYLLTMDEDTEALRNPKLEPFGNARHATIILLGEKEICHFYIAVAEAAVPLLRMEPAMRKIRISSEYAEDDDSDLARYIQSLNRALMSRGL